MPASIAAQAKAMYRGTGCLPASQSAMAFLWHPMASAAATFVRSSRFRHAVRSAGVMRTCNSFRCNRQRGRGIANKGNRRLSSLAGMQVPERFLIFQTWLAFA